MAPGGLGTQSGTREDNTMPGNFGTRIRYAVGSSTARLTHALLSSSWFPLTRYVPRGTIFWYDVACFAATRRLNVIFDVGANVGQTAWGLVRYFPTATIYCFEPASGPFKVLQSQYGSRKNVRCINSALGAAVETRTLSVGGDSELNTFVTDGPRRDRLTARESVQVDTVDRFCETRNIVQIDVLKMDVQGWECEVLRGAGRMIAENRVCFIVSEVGFSRSGADMVHFSDLHAAMERSGYLFCGLYENFRCGPANQFVSFANALYANPRRRAQA